MASMLRLDWTLAGFASQETISVRWTLRQRNILARMILRSIGKKKVFFDVVVQYHLLAIADKIYGNHCAPWSVGIFL